jgi:threonine dehydrogenase-like Zn-dependent dehydrogenase
LKSGALRVADVPDPVPGQGQLLAKSLACTICASDHHMVRHGHRLAAWSREVGGPFDFDADQDLVLGHELCAEVVEYGPDTEGTIPVGERVVTGPMILHGRGMAIVGYSNDYPGGFGEYLVLSESSVLAVPDETPTDCAALMEPLSVGMLYTRVADLQPGDVPLVIGCGAIGLAVVSALRWRGFGPIVASDLSPMRRRVAADAGADVVVNPTEEPPFEAWQRVAEGGRCVVFECVGAPGVLNDIFDGAPWMSRVIVAGQNLSDDTLFTASAHTKGLNVQFGGMPDPRDYSDALDAISRGEIDVEPWLTGAAALDDAVKAFDDSTETERHTRIAIHPQD